jgi:hypothetical protein
VIDSQGSAKEGSAVHVVHGQNGRPEVFVLEESKPLGSSRLFIGYQVRVLYFTKPVSTTNTPK